MVEQRPFKPFVESSILSALTVKNPLIEDFLFKNYWTQMNAENADLFFMRPKLFFFILLLIELFFIKFFEVVLIIEWE